MAEFTLEHRLLFAPTQPSKTKETSDGQTGASLALR